LTALYKFPLADFASLNEGIAKVQNRINPKNPLGFKPVIDMYIILLLDDYIQRKYFSLKNYEILAG
jgi:hypothetical protein